jgi:ABC-type amino acid transport substrate-binding protein
MKRIIGLLVLISLSIGLGACAGQEDLDPNDIEVIVVGLEAAYAPFNWTTPTQNSFTVPIFGQSGSYVDGYDVVIASRIADALGANLVIKAIDWDGLILSLQSGEIDLIIAGMSPTATRAQTVAFTNEYYRSEQVMVVRTSGIYATATTLADFTGARVVAQEGTLQDDLIPQIPGVIHRVPLDSYSFLAQEVTSGTADAFVAELPVAQAMVATNSGLSIVSFSGTNGFTVLDEEIIVSVALRLQDTALVARINEILAEISNTERTEIMEAALGRQPQEA